MFYLEKEFRFVGAIALFIFLAKTPASLQAAPEGNQPRRVPSRSIEGHAASDAPPTTTATNAPISLPPLPDGVAELKFEDFFKTPVGPLGLELTDKIKSLEGKRVRILGFMVREETEKEESPGSSAVGVPLGRLLLTPLPASVSMAHYGLCDDLPPQTVFVTAPAYHDRLIPYRRGPLLVTGKLSLGNKLESDDRTSVVRLTLDEVSPESADTIRKPAAGDKAESNFSSETTPITKQSKIQQTP